MSLQALEFQLEQINASLSLDPENEKLKSLAQKLKSLIELTSKSTLEQTERQQQHQQPAGSRNKEGPERFVQLSIGQLCEAKCIKDGQWWEATVQSISPDRAYCTVCFTGGEAQHCSANQIRPHSGQVKKKGSSVDISRPQAFLSAPVASVTTAAKATTSVASIAGIGPVKRKHTKQEHAQKKEAEHRAKQSNWLAFTSKISKNPVASAPFKKPSIFATAEGPGSKVGVVNSGKPVTDYPKRERHSFNYPPK